MKKISGKRKMSRMKKNICFGKKSGKRKKEKK